MTANIIGLSILLLAVALVVGKIIRVKFKIFSKFFMPTSIISGFLLLFFGPEVLGAFAGRFDIETLEYGLFTPEILQVFSSLPGLLITIIFAGLFLGKRLPSAKNIWLTAGPQVSYGQTAAWGQYVFGILITMILLTPVFGAPPMAGALIEIAFEGGHGTASGLASTFEDVGYAEGGDLAVGLATVGVLSGVIFGVLLINWGVRKQHTHSLKSKDALDTQSMSGIIDKDKREKTMAMTVSPESIEPLALHLGIIAIAVLLGIGILEALVFIENVTWNASGNMTIFGYVPLFPVAMLGGVIVQRVLDRFDTFDIIDREMIARIQGLALDILIVSAIASLSLTVIGENIAIFLILSFTGILWNLIAFIYLAPKMIPKYWFERGIGDFGQSMAMTPVGLMLLRIGDPHNQTRALEAFGYKQLLFEPIVGGGLMTALSVPLIFQFGPLPVFIFSLIIMIIWMMIGIFYFGKKDPDTIE